MEIGLIVGDAWGGVKRIHRASGELEERVAELEQQDEALVVQIAQLKRNAEMIYAIVEAPEVLPKAANA